MIIECYCSFEVDLILVVPCVFAVPLIPCQNQTQVQFHGIKIKVFSNQWYFFFDNVINDIFNLLCGLNFNCVSFFQCPKQTNDIDCGYFVM